MGSSEQGQETARQSDEEEINEGEAQLSAAWEIAERAVLALIAVAAMLTIIYLTRI